MVEEVVEWADMDTWDKQVMTVEANGSAGTPSKQCFHPDLEKCPKCSPHKKKALQRWKTANKKKAATIVKKKLNKKFAAAQSAAGQQGISTPTLKLLWREVARNSAWVTEISRISRQWQVCDQHQRFQYDYCMRCKRARDTAHNQSGKNPTLPRSNEASPRDQLSI